ncbi:MAG: hypothetical protein F6K39_33710 [Okeania sp. SIO3B3]|nr:hypothetical protein [Okeania sp. SIO3B3]
MKKSSKYNAEKINSSGKEGQHSFNRNPYNQEAFEANISSFRNESKRVNRTMDKGGRITVSKTTVGGILDRLKTLQSIHLEYVEEHGKRLEQRLIENHTHKSKVFEEMRSLEVELVHLLESAEEEDLNEEE